MGVISVSGPQYGQLYNINIAGDAPTPDEQQRINQWVGQQEQLLASQIQERFGVPAAQAETPVAGEKGDDSTAIGRGFRRGIENVQSLFGTALEEAGKGVGLKGLETYGRELEQESEADLRKLDALARTTRRDVEGVGTGLSYVGEVAGEQAPILGATLTGAGTGAAIGSMFGPLGTAAGAVIGGAAASFPLLFGGNVQRQEEQVAAGELDKVDIERALIAAGGQAAIEGIAGKVLALMPFKPGVGSLWARARKGAVAGAGTEIPTEVTQQLIERAQAGLPIDNDEAIQEYIDAGVAAGILGGGIGTVGGGFRKDQSKIELDQDLAERDPDLAEAPPPGTLLLEAPEPEITVAAEQAVTPEPAALLEQGVDPYAAEGFTINEYNAVLEQITNDGELLFPKAQAAIRERTGRKTVPTQVIRQIASVLEREGKISKSKRAKLDRYTLTPINQRAQEEIDILRRDTNNTLDAIRKITKTLPRLELDLRYAEQVGKDTSGKTTTADAARKKLQDKQVLLNKLNERLQRNQERLRSVNQDFNVPVSEKIGLPATKIRVQDFIEADRLRQQEELQKAREAADARAAADVVRQRKDEKVEVRTESYTAEQGKVLEELKRRLLGLGLKDVRLEGRAAVRDDAGNMGYEGASYTSPEGDQVIALSMGIYRPDLDQDAYIKRLGDVMNHEIIHAVRNLGLFTKKELELLSKAARKTNYVKTANGKTVKRNYTYFDRAQRINPELSVKKDKRGVLSALEEEAIAEMFRDYTAGKLTKIGQSRSLLKRIGDFFRSIVGAHVDSGFNSVDKIFGGLNKGAVGTRQRPDVEVQAATKASRLPAVEEEIVPLQNIRMPLDMSMPPDQIRAQLQRMTNQNRPLVKNLINRIDQRFGTKSGDNVKDLSKVTQKARRPSILSVKPWHDVSHIRDSYRFKTIIDDFRNVPAIFNELLRDGISLVKIDTNKLFQPKEWGWRIIAFDLRMPNGQLVEWYLPLRELEAEKKSRGHLIFEEWRNKTQEQLARMQNEYFDAIGRSYRYYDQAFEAALDRMGISRQDAEASWRSAESSMLEAARNARNSSGFGISSGAKTPTGLMEPSAVRTALEPSSMNMTARDVPSSIRANASSDIGVTPSDIDVTGIPLEQQPKFSRVARSPAVGGLSNFIKNNPDGFTISPDTYEPVSGGYVVAPLKEAEIIVGKTLPEEVLLDYIQDNKDIARAVGKPVYLGGWFDSESGQYFLDNTLNVPTLEEALYIAEAAEQLAVFDLNNFEEVRTDEGIRRLQQSGAYSDNTAIGYKRRLEEIGRRFAEARNNRNAIEKEQLIGTPDPKFSRLTIPLTPEQRDASILDYLDPETGKPLFNAKQGAETLVSFANKLLGLRNTRSYDIVNSEQDREDAARVFAAEAEAALLSSSDAIGWYDATLKLAKRVLSIRYPEISPVLFDGSVNPEFDPDAEVAFDFATAVTSNGLAVTDNYDFAANQYEALRGSEDGKFPVKGKGKQGSSMHAAFEFWNILTDQGYSPVQINDLLMTEARRNQIDDITASVLGVDKKDLPKKLIANTKEGAREIVSVAYLLGPKIGNGFYRNLRGNFDPITMDRWWMRFINRITGNPIKNISDEVIENNIDGIWGQIQKQDLLQELDKEILALASARLDTKRLKRSDMQDLIPIMNDIYESDFYKKAYNDKIEQLEAEGYRRADAQTRRIAEAARPERTPFLKNVGTYVDNITTQLQEDPRGIKDRAAMRDLTARAKRILQDALGVEITNADMQALMWYAEKRIFAAGGVRRGRGQDNDYTDGAIYVLKKRGVNDDRIKSALPSSERYRVGVIDDELKADDQANAATVAVEPAREGDFFGPRRLALEERGLYEDLTVEEQALAEQDLSEIDLGDRPPVMFSRIPTAPYKAVRSPVQGGGILDYAYGFISEAGRKVPVILPEGSHKEFDNGTEVGQGLYHIHRRMHDKELIENSKYKRVENAIYDLMRRWQNQGFDNGDSVVSYLSRDGGLTLEWRNNLAFSAPPLQLVLERKKVKDVPIYFVKTFFPILDKKDRAYVPKRGVKRAAYEARYSRIPQYARVGQTATPFIGPSDLAARAESIRYTKVQDIMAKYLAKVPFISDRTAQEKTEAFMTKLQDSMLPVGKMYDKLRERYGPNVITQDMDAYFQESLMHGVAGPKKEKFDRTSFRPVLEQVANMTVTDQENAALERMSGYYRDIVEKHKNKSHALANAYLYALHAKERNARISQISNGKIQNGSGMSNAEANNIIGFVDSLSPIKRDALRNIDRQVQDMIRQTNEVYIEGGLIPDYLLDEDIDDDVRAQFEKYGNYVPLRGYADPEADLDVANDRVLSSTNRLGAKGKPNPYALGRTSYAGDILANVAVQHHQAIDKAERNKVGQSLLKLLESDDIDTSEFGRVLDEHPVKRVMVNGTIRYVPDRDFNDPDAPILAVRRGGKEYLLLLDPKIATSMKGTLSPKQANASVRFLHNITRFYANLLTSYNPAFLLSNWPRDIETAIFNSQQYEMKGASKDIIKNVPKAFASILKTVNGKEGGDPYWINRYKEFYENGGQNVLNQMSNLMSASQDIQGTIRDIVGADNQGLTQKVKNGFIGKGASVLSYIEALNTAVENSTRLAFFDRMASELSAQGVPQKEALKRAAFAARNLTTNFAKGGEYKNGLNSLYLFFNASMQGSMAIFNSLANSKKARKLAGSIVVMGFLMDQINAALSDEDEATGIKNYDDISEYTLGHNLILPDLNGDGNYVKIPMAYGLNTLFNFGRITSNLIRGAMGTEGTYTPSQAGKELVGYVTEMINPFGGNSPLTFLSPTVGDLPIELLTNNDFRDAPIYKELSPYQPYLSRSGLYWSTTSPSAVWISKFINDTVGGGDDYVPGEILGMRVDIQPDVIEHIFGFMTGGVGRLLSQTVDTATSNIPNAAMGQWESDMIKTTPFLNKFLTAVTDKDRSSDYYDKRDDVFAVRRSFRAALEDGDRQQALAIRQKNPEIVRVMEPINKIDRAITKLRKRLKMIKSSKQIGEAQRKELIDKVEDRIYLLQSRGIQLMQGI